MTIHLFWIKHVCIYVVVTVGMLLVHIEDRVYIDNVLKLMLVNMFYVIV